MVTRIDNKKSLDNAASPVADKSNELAVASNVPVGKPEQQPLTPEAQAALIMGVNVGRAVGKPLRLAELSGDALNVIVPEHAKSVKLFAA
jgi:hypothetical protein